MIKRSQIKFALAVGIAASFATVALCVAAPPGTLATSLAYLYVGGHTFGLGEQQVYAIERDTSLTVRYKDASGNVKTPSFDQHVQSSVAWTIEGFSSTGSPVIALAFARYSSAGGPVLPIASGSPLELTAVAPSPTQAPSPQSPQPSPALDAHGALHADAPMADIDPVSIILSGLQTDLPGYGRPWKSAGDIRLPYGALSVAFDNNVVTATGDQDPNVTRVASTGTTSFDAKLKVAGFGLATLRGSGSASGTSFTEGQNKLLLATSLLANSHGNASAGVRRGTYDLTVKVTIWLAKYVPGIPLYTGSPGFVPASDYLGETTAPDSQIYSTTAPDGVAAPAATDTGFIPGPLPVASAYHSSLPEASLPPIPLALPSDPTLASPPPGPSPTPQPTHY